MYCCQICRITCGMIEKIRENMPLRRVNSVHPAMRTSLALKIPAVCVESAVSIFLPTDRGSTHQTAQKRA